jgi:hypothetical protein
LFQVLVSGSNPVRRHRHILPLSLGIAEGLLVEGLSVEGSAFDLRMARDGR